MHQMYQPHKSWKCERVGIHSFSVALLNQIKESTFLNDFFFFLIYSTLQLREIAAITLHKIYVNHSVKRNIFDIYFLKNNLNLHMNIPIKGNTTINSNSVSNSNVNYESSGFCCNL